MIGWVALVAALAFLGLGALGFRKALRLKMRPGYRMAAWASAAIVGAISSLSAAYPVDDRTRVYGFPLPAAAFQRDEGGAWLDFVGPFTTPFMLLNWLIHVGVVMYLVAAVVERRSATTTKKPTAHSG
jgi:hypothetical protein